MLNKNKLISDMKEAFLLGVPDELSEQDKIKTSSFAQAMSEIIATAIHDYLSEAAIEVSEGISVGTENGNNDKLKTTTKGNGKIK